LKKTIETGDSIYSLLELENGYLASGGDAGIIKLWNITDGSLKKILTGLGTTVDILIQLNDGKLFCSHYGSSPYYRDSTQIIIYNITDGFLRTYSYINGALISILKLYNGNLLAFRYIYYNYYYSDNYYPISILNGTDASLITIFNNDPNLGINNLIFLKNGYLAGGGSDGQIRIYS
jgi:WD40 repeat protein